jgi:hypothetical protein
MTRPIRPARRGVDACLSCHGTGVQQCVGCSGKGRIVDGRGRERRCGGCSGDGWMRDPDCRGTGWKRGRRP